jgi:hypothetical protein
MVQCAGGTHRLAHQHAIVGAGLKPAPTMHAVTGMIGATTAGERVRIAPGSAGRWPVWCSARVEPIVWRISTPWWGVGAGLKPAPTMHAVTGMIGATTVGERVRISPGSAGRWPVWCSVRVEPIV